MEIKTAVRLFVALVLPLLATKAFGAARETDLIHLSLELLLRIHVPSPDEELDPVFGATAIYVIDSEDIRRSGVRSAPEALRLVPGLRVARLDGSKWAISADAHGEGGASQLLVTVDGRRVHAPRFSGLLWETPETFLEHVERVEVVRGPGAALWGADAVNGVVNIVTCRRGDAESRCGGGAGSARTEPDVRAGPACRF